METLAVLEAHPRHVFWNDGFGYRQVAYHALGQTETGDGRLARATGETEWREAPHARRRTGGPAQQRRGAAT